MGRIGELSVSGTRTAGSNWSGAWNTWSWLDWSALRTLVMALASNPCPTIATGGGLARRSAGDGESSGTGHEDVDEIRHDAGGHGRIVVQRHSYRRPATSLESRHDRGHVGGPSRAGGDGGRGSGQRKGRH